MAGPPMCPGWYDDPHASDGRAERYWDGSTWTPRRRPKKPAEATHPTPPQYAVPPAPPPPTVFPSPPPLSAPGPGLQTPPVYPTPLYQAGPTPQRSGWGSWTRGTKMGVATGVAVIGLLLALGLSGKLSPGPSESYLWGQRAGNSAVSLVHAGVEPGTACKTSIEAGMMFSDNPILNPTPPPDNFDITDIQTGCLDQLHKRLGY